MALNGKPKVLISIILNNLYGTEDRAFWANISVETGGYIHNRDTIKTEKRPYHDAAFDSKLCVEYLFEEKQMIIIEVFEYDPFHNRDNLLGEVDCSIGRVIHSGGIVLKPLELTSNYKISIGMSSPEVGIFVEEDITSKEILELKLRGVGLAKTEIFGKTDPYLMIFRCNNRGRYVQCYRTEVLKNTQDPDWSPLVVSYEKLCNSNLDSILCLRVYCGDGNVKESEEVDIACDPLVGEIKVTARELLQMRRLEQKKFEGFPIYSVDLAIISVILTTNSVGYIISHRNFSINSLINPKKKLKKKSYLNSGIVRTNIPNKSIIYKNQIYVHAQKTNSEPTFLDFMFQGLELNFIVAIDLTLSNGDSSLPSSLHFMDCSLTNEYSIAIQAVLEILQEYDNDELFPAFGFGARIPPDYKICHEYPLNGDFENPYCRGAEGVIQAYQQTLKEVKLAGPTCFSPVIRHVSRLAKASNSGKHYFILLILTDGSVDDWVETKKSVVETSYLPVSIIVVGVGGGKFSDMETLDQDFGLLMVSNERACRDNVQFVKMRRYLRAAADGSDNIRWSKVALAKDVLAELPYQVNEYMYRKTELTNYLENLPTQRSTSVFSSCLRQNCYSDPNTLSLHRTPTLNQSRRLLYKEGNNNSQTRSKLLKNTRQYSVDSSLLAKQVHNRKTPPFSRKFNFS